jgi:hypothetical protein
MKQDDREPREFSFGSVLLFGAGCQRFEPNALATVLHAVIDTAADHIRVWQVAHSPPVTHHPEIADHLAAVRARAGQVGRHPAPVMDQQPPRGQRLRQARGQAGLSASARTGAISASDPGSYKDFDTLISQFRSTSY